MDFEIAKPACEAKVVFGGDVLIPEEDDFPVQKGLFDRLHGGVVLLFSEVDAPDFRADGGGQGVNLDFMHEGLSEISCG